MEASIYDQFINLVDIAVLERQFIDNPSSNMLIVIPEPCAHNELIEKILSAINIHGLDEINLLRLTNGQACSLYNLIKDKEIEKIISFGFDGPTLGLNVEYQPYQRTPFKGRSFVFTANLDILSRTPDHKKALWSTLKSWK